MLTIVDYGVGNLASMQNMLKKVGVASQISSSPAEIEKATQLILPGVGAFDTCSQKLQESGLKDILEEQAHGKKIPVLGVCVGMQLLMEGSEEGVLPGLGWIPGKVVRFRQDMLPPGTKVPHMGWTDVEPAKDSKLFGPVTGKDRFYFVHSYHAQLADNSHALLYAQYGYRFVAGVERDNIMGVQFHPEKSHKFGMNFLKNFATAYA